MGSEALKKMAPAIAHLYTEKRLRRGFAAAMITLIVIIAGTLWFCQRVATSERRVHLTYDVLFHIRNVVSVLVELEARHENSAIPKATLERVTSQLAIIQEQTADNPRQQHRIAALQKLIVPGLRIGTHLRELSGLLNQMQSDEEALLETRANNLKLHFRLVFSAMGVISALLMLVFVRTYFAIRRELVTQRQSEERFRALLDSAPDATLIVDESGRLVLASSQVKSVFGYEPHEVLGKEIEALLPDSLRKEHVGKRRAYLSHPVRRSLGQGRELRGVRKDGSQISVEVSLSPLKTDKGLLIISSVRDVTQRRVADEAIRKLSSVTEQTADSVLITDRYGTIEYVNPAFEAMTGYSKNEVIGRSPSFLKSGQHEKSVYEDLWKTILAGQPFRAVMINQKKNGEHFYAEKTITPLVDARGDITHFVSTDKDITERKRMEADHRQLSKRFREIFEYSKDGMAYTALDGTLLDVNPAYVEMTGYTREELLADVRYQDITPADYHEVEARYIAEVHRTGAPVEYEKEYFHKDGHRYPVLLTIFPVKDAEHRTTAMAAIVKDIAERKRSERELQAMTQDLKRSNAELERFAYSASHDLQEPLRMVASYLTLLENRNRDRLDQDSLEFLEYAKDGATRLKKLITGLLEYSRAGSQPIRLIPTNSEQVFKNVLLNLRILIAETGATVTHEALPICYSDPALLEQLLQNLVSNALKYRGVAPPRIEVAARKRKMDWVFSVRDNGIGISSEGQERVFDIFQRLHGREIPGTGIGLATCKKIVERLGGELWVDSNLGKGSTFYFSVRDADAANDVGRKACVALQLVK
jgi:PAS domain S-box-containing protein